MGGFLSRTFDDRYGYPGYYDLVRCPTCELIETWPRLRDEDLPGIYSEYYPRREVDLATLADGLLDVTTAWGRFLVWLRGAGNQGHLLAQPGMKVLDYGCGMATSLMELRRIGAEPFGIEIDPNVRRVATHFNLAVHVGTLKEHPFPGVAFDLISLNQVAEHVPNPTALLRAVRARLARGGEVVLSFPNVDSVYRRIFGRRWINWHVPFHLQHFNRKSFERLCQNEGWRILAWRTVTPTIWTSLQLRTLLTVARMGHASRLWRGTSSASPTGSPWHSVPGRRLRRLARGFLRLAGGVAIIVVNRLIDLLGLGDSAVIRIAPTERGDRELRSGARQPGASGSFQ